MNAPKEITVKDLMLNNQAWNQEKVMDIVCAAIATSSRGIGNIITQGIEDHGGFPDYSTIMRWIEKDEVLCKRYARAKEAQADFMADEMLDICDDARNDYMERIGKDGEETGFKVPDKELIQRSKLRIDTRKWLASKLKPKKYGDKIQTELTGPDGGPIEVTGIEVFFVKAKEVKDEKN